MCQVHTGACVSLLAPGKNRLYTEVIVVVVLTLNLLRDHKTGSNHSGAEECPREKQKQTKVVHAYIYCS